MRDFPVRVRGVGIALDQYTDDVDRKNVHGFTWRAGRELTVPRAT